MKVLALLLALAVIVSASPRSEPKFLAKWGVPGFEDEACVLCQYAVERVQNLLVKRLDAIDKGQATLPGGGISTSDPFAVANPNQPAPMPGFATSAADAAGVNTIAASNPPASMMDLSFEPSHAYKKQMIRSLRARWGGSSILRSIWESFLVDFCAQDKLPEIYVPVCSMFYASARKIMKLIYYNFPIDQICLMSNMCGRNSYFATPTAVHDPVMSLYWNNRRGLDGFEGGVHGLTEVELKQIAHNRKYRAANARHERTERRKHALNAAEKAAEAATAAEQATLKNQALRQEIARETAEMQRKQLLYRNNIARWNRQRAVANAKMAAAGALSKVVASRPPPQQPKSWLQRVVSRAKEILKKFTNPTTPQAVSTATAQARAELAKTKK